MELLVIVGSILVGWLLGGVGNWAADHLPAYPDRPLPWASDLPRRLLIPRQGVGQGGQRSLWLQVGTALAVGITAWQLVEHPWWVGAVVALYVAFLLTVLVIDLEHRRVLNVMLVPAALVALGASLLPGMPGIVAALLGGLAGFGLFLVVFLLGRGRMGAGDVKLAGVIGLMTGIADVAPALVGGIVLGGLAAIYLLVVRKASRKTSMAYAPYLALGAMVTFWLSWGG